MNAERSGAEGPGHQQESLWGVTLEAGGGAFVWNKKRAHFILSCNSRTFSKENWVLFTHCLCEQTLRRRTAVANILPLP